MGTFEHEKIEQAFKPGDIVRYTAQFLRDTGQYTGNAINGLIVESKPSNLYLVRWCDRPDTVLVNGANIEIDQRVTTSSDRWTV